MRTGSTLLLALVLTSALLATTIAIGSVVSVSLQSARAVDGMLAASYAAASGVEELLFRVRRAGVTSGLDDHRMLASGAMWDRTVDTAFRELTFDFPRDVARDIDLPTGIGTSGVAQLQALRIIAPHAQPNTTLTITWVPWVSAVGWGSVIGTVVLRSAEFQSSPTLGTLVDLEEHLTSGAPIAYRMTLQASGADCGVIRMHAMGDRVGMQLVAFPEWVHGTVIGASGNARAALRVAFTVPSPSGPPPNSVQRIDCVAVPDGTTRCPS